MSLKQQYRRRSRKASRRWRRRPWLFRSSESWWRNRIERGLREAKEGKVISLQEHRKLLDRDPFLEEAIKQMQKPVGRCPICGELPGGTLYTFLLECRNGHKWEPE